jgi:hypothetical protein
MDGWLRRARPSPFASILSLCLLAGAGFVAWLEAEPARALRQRERAWGHALAPGDVLFQDLDCGPRCELIRAVTHSAYAHVGLVLADARGEPVVWEAFAPVGPTPLVEFVQRGRGRHLGVYRLEPALRAQLPAIAEAVRAMAGRPYDGNYQWDDARLYCSELVEKAVQRATGVELAPPRPLGPGAFGGHATTIARMSQGRLTEQTPLTSPADLARSPHLERIVDELQPPPDPRAAMP